MLSTAYAIASSSIPIPGGMMSGVFGTAGSAFSKFLPLIMLIIAAQGFIFLSGVLIGVLRRYIEHRRLMRDMRLIEKNGYIAEKIVKMTDEVARAVAELKKLGYTITQLPRGVSSGDKISRKAFILHEKFKKL